jgi:hypothetical protein
MMMVVFTAQICWGAMLPLNLNKVGLLSCPRSFWLLQRRRRILRKILRLTERVKIQAAMIGSSTAEYIFIRACILFLHNIAPVGVLVTIRLLFLPYFPQSIRHYSIPFPIEAWLVAEALFFAVIFLPLRFHLQRSTIYSEPLSQEERDRLFRYCNSNVADLEEYLRRWLMIKKDGQIKRGNVKDFIRWAFFHSEMVQEQHEAEVEVYTRETEKLLGRDLPPGRDKTKGLGQMLNEFDGFHRSLLWYTVCLVLAALF